MKKLLLALLFLASILPGVSSADGIVYLSPQLKFGLSIKRSLDIKTTAIAIKDSNGNLYGYHIFNNAGSVRYFKFYNVAAAGVTVGTTTPTLTIPMPPGAAANVEWSMGVTFSVAISVACTTGVADNDTGAPASNECIGDIYYK